VQIVAQLAQAEDIHVNDGNLGALLNSLGNDSGERVVEGLDVRSESRVLRRNDLGYDDDGLRNGLEDIVQQEPESLWCIGVWFRRWVASVEIVCASVEEDNIGLECETTGSDAADLVDGVAREALVVLVGHGA
jgi:hypothetical protein